jgi:hypothetical protein
MMEGPCADSEEKREPAGDIDTVVMDGLKVLDPKRPIREADILDAMATTILGVPQKTKDHEIQASVIPATVADLTRRHRVWSTKP